MSHLVGVIAFIIFAVILAYNVPQKVLVGGAIYFLVAALIVKISAQIVTKRDVSILKALAAVVVSLIVVPLAGVAAMQIGVKSGPALFILVPALMFLAQLIAYMVMLEVTLLASGLISILVMVVTWGASVVFGLSFTTAFKALA